MLVLKEMIKTMMTMMTQCWSEALSVSASPPFPATPPFLTTLGHRATHDDDDDDDAQDDDDDTGDGDKEQNGDDDGDLDLDFDQF